MRIELDKFNSDIFGLMMGNIVDVSDLKSEEELSGIISDAKENGYQHLNVKVAVGEKGMTNMFLKNGFILVDTQVTYQINTKYSSAYERDWGGVFLDDVVFRKYRSRDKLQIESIARDAYSLDQFHSDEKLPSQLCDDYYVEWIRNSCKGLADKVMVLSCGDTIAGYITLKYREGGCASVGLAAVGKPFQQKGYFTFLIKQSLRMLYEEGIEYLYYGTQLANEPVLHVMSKYLGVPVSSNHVLHCMI